jgi:hypothetical protein
MKAFFVKRKSWEQVEYFDPAWEDRIRQMAGYIKEGESVMDLGCGKMLLKNYLKTNKYIPVDYTSRGEDTIIVDFNKKEFPGFYVDICFVSGTLEYVKDYKWFIEKTCKHSKKVILSYCTTDNFPDRKTRITNSWVNHLSEQTLIGLFMKEKFELSGKTETKTRNQIFIFESV